jgi:hypothetical protein
MEHLSATGYIINVLRNTLRRLEEGGAFTREDPALIHLKRRLILAIAELEVQKNQSAASDRANCVGPALFLRVRESNPASRASELELCYREE